MAYLSIRYEVRFSKYRFFAVFNIKVASVRNGKEFSALAVGEGDVLDYAHAVKNMTFDIIVMRKYHGAGQTQTRKEPFVVLGSEASPSSSG